MEYKELAKSILPKGLLEYFEVSNVKIVSGTAEDDDYYVISLEEHNTLPEGYKLDDYESKGFYKARLVQDFPLRGKAVYL